MRILLKIWSFESYQASHWMNIGWLINSILEVIENPIGKSYSQVPLSESPIENLIHSGLPLRILWDAYYCASNWMSSDRPIKSLLRVLLRHPFKWLVSILLRAYWWSYWEVRRSENPIKNLNNREQSMTFNVLWRLYKIKLSLEYVLANTCFCSTNYMITIALYENRIYFL